MFQWTPTALINDFWFFDFFLFVFQWNPISFRYHLIRRCARTRDFILDFSYNESFFILFVVLKYRVYFLFWRLYTTLKKSLVTYLQRINYTIREYEPILLCIIWIYVQFYKYVFIIHGYVMCLFKIIVIESKSVK